MLSKVTAQPSVAGLEATCVREREVDRPRSKPSRSPSSAPARATGARRLLTASFGALALIVLLVLAGPALAQDQASADVEPSASEPGEDLELIFRMESPDLAEVVVEERIRCTITFPDGSERSPCDRTGGLAEVRTAGSGAREYVFAYQAPAQAGDYDVSFEAESTARVLPATYTANASFAVVDEAPAPQGQGPTDEEPSTGDDEGTPGEEPGDGPGATDDGNDETDAIGTLGGTDASRFMVSTSMATGVLAVTLVANRVPLGGRP